MCHELSCRCIVRTEIVSRLNIDKTELCREHYRVIILVIRVNIRIIVIRIILLLYGHVKCPCQLFKPFNSADIASLCLYIHCHKSGKHRDSHHTEHKQCRNQPACSLHLLSFLPMYFSITRWQTTCYLHCSVIYVRSERIIVKIMIIFIITKFNINVISGRLFVIIGKKNLRKCLCPVAVSSPGVFYIAD